jgi:hypothetical protein
MQAGGTAKNFSPNLTPAQNTLATLEYGQQQRFTTLARGHSTKGRDLLLSACSTLTARLPISLESGIGRRRALSEARLLGNLAREDTFRQIY